MILCWISAVASYLFSYAFLKNFQDFLIFWNSLKIHEEIKNMTAKVWHKLFLEAFQTHGWESKHFYKITFCSLALE